MWRDDALLLDIARFAQAAIHFTREPDQAAFIADADEKRWGVAAQITVNDRRAI